MKRQRRCDEQRQLTPTAGASCIGAIGGAHHVASSSSSASANGGHDDAENADLLRLRANGGHDDAENADLLPNALTEAIHPLSQLKRQPHPFMALPWFYFLVRDKRQVQASCEFAVFDPSLHEWHLLPLPVDQCNYMRQHMSMFDA
ncbi:hypothetical protein GOP47_0002275, partial [Adiantum capillus-veneris]